MIDLERLRALDKRMDEIALELTRFEAQQAAQRRVQIPTKTDG